MTSNCSPMQSGSILSNGGSSYRTGENASLQTCWKLQYSAQSAQHCYFSVVCVCSVHALRNDDYILFRCNWTIRSTVRCIKTKDSFVELLRILCAWRFHKIKLNFHRLSRYFGWNFKIKCIIVQYTTIYKIHTSREREHMFTSLLNI